MCDTEAAPADTAAAGDAKAVGQRPGGWHDLPESRADPGALAVCRLRDRPRNLSPPVWGSRAGVSPAPEAIVAGLGAAEGPAGEWGLVTMKKGRRRPNTRIPKHREPT